MKLAKEVLARAGLLDVARKVRAGMQQVGS